MATWIVAIVLALAAAIHPFVTAPPEMMATCTHEVRSTTDGALVKVVTISGPADAVDAACESFRP